MQVQFRPPAWVKIMTDAAEVRQVKNSRDVRTDHRPDEVDVGFRERRTSELLRQANAPDIGEAERKRLLDLVVRLNLQIADSLARRYRSRGETLDDLTQVARMGLVQAVHRFDPENGTFVGFAVPTITGEIKRHFRDHCWTVRPPRRIQELHSDVSVAWSELAQEQAATPTADQIAGRLDADRGEVLEAMRSNAFASASLDASSDSGAATLDLMGSPDPGFTEVEEAEDRRQVMQEVRRACAQLTAEEREVLRMRFQEGRSQSSIADELGVSQMSVSRRLRKITTDLRGDIVAHRHRTPSARMMRNRSIGVARRQRIR